MSRIDDALRKAEQKGLNTPVLSEEAAPVPPAEEFEAPWTLATPRETSRPEPRRETAPASTSAALLEDLDRPLAVFRGFKPELSERLVVGDAARPGLVEQYRRLAATLHHAQVDRGLKILLVTSALAEEGKTLTATNLALTLGESYRRQVLLIDADLRRPTLHDVFQVPNVSGLSDGLHASGDQKLSLIQISERVTLLTAGRPDPDPMHVITSERMHQILAEAKARFDWVILDTPPVAVLSDANLLAAMVDAALLVIRAGKTPFEMIQKAVDAVGRERILGTVLNATDDDATTPSDYYQYYYSQTPRDGSRARK